MSLPASIGKAGVSADQLMAESMALRDPLGVSVLSLRPEEFEGDLPGLPRKVRAVTRGFLTDMAGGDPQRQREMFEAYKRSCKHIQICVKKSASRTNYTDAHTGWLEGPQGEALGGVIVEPREKNYSFAQNMKNLTDVKKEQFLATDVSDAQGRFMCHWHEVAHCAGAHEEPNADKIAAIMVRKAFPDSSLPQVNADLRALDTLFSANLGNARSRIRRYGWQMVEAADSVLAMPPEQVKDMSETDLLSLRNEPFRDYSGSVEKIWEAMSARRPGLLAERNLKETGAELKSVLADGALAADPMAQKIAARMVLAIDRLADPAWSPALTDQFNASAEARTNEQQEVPQNALTPSKPGALKA